MMATVLRALGLAACLAGCAVDDPGVVDLENSHAKTDGSAGAAFRVRPGAHSSFRVQCDEWFSCDLRVQITPDEQMDLRPLAARVLAAQPQEDVVKLELYRVDIWSYAEMPRQRVATRTVMVCLDREGQVACGAEDAARDLNVELAVHLPHPNTELAIDVRLAAEGLRDLHGRIQAWWR